MLERVGVKVEAVEYTGKTHTDLFVQVRNIFRLPNSYRKHSKLMAWFRVLKLFSNSNTGSNERW